MSFNAEAIAEHIVKWLDDYSAKSGVSAFIVGVSGGIDSAVTASLCARTPGRASTRPRANPEQPRADPTASRQ